MRSNNPGNLEGVKEKCVFHGMAHFNVEYNYVVDFSHDILFGVWKKVGHLIIRRFVSYKMNDDRSGYRDDDKPMTLQSFNDALKIFKFQYSGRPWPIKEDMFEKGFQFNMTDNLCLILACPMILGCRVPGSDPYYKLLVDIVVFVNLCLADSFNENMLELLDDTAAEINKKTMELFIHDFNLSFKFHILTHYSTVVRQSGPISKLSTIRLEGNSPLYPVNSSLFHCTFL